MPSLLSLLERLLAAVAGFPSRAALVTWITTNTPKVGTVLWADAVSYRYIGSGTAIADMPGWVINLSGGGGGGSPGGTATQMQYNNSGAFDGASDVKVLNGQLALTTASGLAVPAAGNVKIIGRTRAGRTVPAFLSQDGVLRGVQSALSGNSPLIWKGQRGSVAMSTIGAAALTAIGTATAVSAAVTNLYSMMPKIEYLVTTAISSAIAGFRYSELVTTVGAASGLGGFDYACQWGPATGVGTTTCRAFVGLAATVASAADVEPSTLLSCIGMGWDSADTNVQMFYNDATGACTKFDLGASFPVPTAERTAVYELRMYSPKSTTQTVFWTVTDMVSGAIAENTITTDLPAISALLSPRGWISAGGTSSLIGFGLTSLYLDALT